MSVIRGISFSAPIEISFFEFISHFFPRDEEKRTFTTAEKNNYLGQLVLLASIHFLDQTICVSGGVPTIMKNGMCQLQ